MRCPSCGREVSDQSFCEWCGKPLKAEETAPIEQEPVTPSASKPSSPSPSLEESGAAPQASLSSRAVEKPGNASSQLRWHGIVWAALAIVLYLAIADAAVETFLRDSPLRWWIAGAAALYLVLCAVVWRLMPKLWRRLNWADQAGSSLIVLLALMSATAWMPGGLVQGLSLFGQPTSIVLALVSAVVVALSGIFFARLHFVPLAGKIVAGLLAVYGVAAFLLAVNAGTPYPSLFHGGSQWTRLPFWLQGATVGGLFLVPLALLMEIVTGLRRITRARISDLGFKVVALGMSLVITVAAVRMPAAYQSEATTRPQASAGNLHATPYGLAPGTQAATSKAPKAPSLAELFLAQTKVQQEAQGAARNIFRYSFLFPTKTTAELTITLHPNQRYVPTPQESKASRTGAKVYGLKTSNDIRTNSYTLNYSVPYSSLPPDVVLQLRGMPTGPAALDRPMYAPRLRRAAYFPRAGIEAAAGGGQESPPVPLTGNKSDGQGEEAVSVTVVLTWVEAALEDLEAFCKGAGLEIEKLGIAGKGVSAILNLSEAWMLMVHERALLAQISAYQYCADNLSDLGVNPSRVQPGTQEQADKIAGYAPGDVLDQFVAMLAKEAATLITWVPLLGPTVEDSLNENLQRAQSDLNQDLENLRNTLPYCTGMWYGNYRVTGSGGYAFTPAIQVGGSGPATFSEFGSLHFSVTNGHVNGKLDGNFQGNINTPGLYNCTVKSSYPGLLNGIVQKGGNFFSTTLESVPASPTGPSISCTGPLCDVKGSPCGSVPSDNTQNPHWLGSLGFHVTLSDGQTSDYEMYSAPADAPYVQVGFKGHVTVTVMKLQ
jgi:hypothetical protein